MKIEINKVDEVDNLVMGIIDGLKDLDTEIMEIISIAEDNLKILAHKMEDV